MIGSLIGSGAAEHQWFRSTFRSSYTGSMEASIARVRAKYVTNSRSLCSLLPRATLAKEVALVGLDGSIVLGESSRKDV
jgi:hypothetical protein